MVFLCFPLQKDTCGPTSRLIQALRQVGGQLLRQKLWYLRAGKAEVEVVAYIYYSRAPKMAKLTCKWLNYGLW
jgi:hypothetical protein